MLCSGKELGISTAAEGILEFPEGAPVGVSVRDYLALDDHLFTLKMTPNRGDCLSLAGVAREVAAITSTPMTPVDCTPVPAQIDESLAVHVEDEQACPVYCGRVIRGLNVKASTPDWMARRLERSGLRAIHPVVDVTNYVLLELGEPMHAFDLAKRVGAIVVRRARTGEHLALLNDENVELDPETLIIADDQGPLALAGIMGGAASAVSPETTDIFLEAAHFTPKAMAGRARRYGLNTDSSHRFERGVDATLPALAMARATGLILDICGGMAGPVVTAGPGLPPPAAIDFNPDQARRLLGIELADDEIESYLSRLGMQVDTAGQVWKVMPPSHRFDLAVAVDLIEEVARLKGYDHIPARPPRGQAHLKPVPEDRRSVARIKQHMTDLGYQEVVTYSFIAETAERELFPDRTAIPLLNPIASQMGVMRGSLLPGLLQTLRHNLNHGQERLRLFEFGRCFLGTGPDQQPLKLAGLAYGAAEPEQWGLQGRAVDFYDLKGDLEALFWPVLAQYEVAEHPALHPGQCARIRVNGLDVGWLGALHPRLVQQYGLAKAPMLFELDWNGLATRPLPGYERVSRFPAVRRDLAVVVDDTHSIGAILASVQSRIPELVTDFSLFDVYQGQGIEAGKKSLAFRVLLQHTEKTLTDADIESAMAGIMDVLTSEFAAVLRA